MKLYGDATPSPQHRQKSEPLPPGTRIEWEPIEVPEDSEILNAWARQYLEERGIDMKLAVGGFALCWWPSTQRIVIPYFDDKGDIIFLAAHSPDVQPKYMYPKGLKPLYVPYRCAAELYERAVIVEGQFDGMIAMMAGYKAIAIGGSYLAPHVEQDLLEEIGDREVSVCLDGDALIPASKLVQRLLELGVYARIVILKPGEDPASVGTERLKGLIG